jgi:hypothetical protein
MSKSTYPTITTSSDTLACGTSMMNKCEYEQLMQNIQLRYFRKNKNAKKRKWPTISLKTEVLPRTSRLFQENCLPSLVVRRFAGPPVARLYSGMPPSFFIENYRV